MRALGSGARAAPTRPGDLRDHWPSDASRPNSRQHELLALSDIDIALEFFQDVAQRELRAGHVCEGCRGQLKGKDGQCLILDRKAYLGPLEPRGHIGSVSRSQDARQSGATAGAFPANKNHIGHRLRRNFQTLVCG